MDAKLIVEQLDTRDIAERLEALEAERKALMILSRAAKARERAIARRSSRTERLSDPNQLEAANR